MESNRSARPAVDCGEMARGKGREENTLEKASGGKPGSRGGRALLLSRVQGWSHYWSLSLPTCQHWQLTNRERPQRGQPFELLLPQAVEKDQSERPFEHQLPGQEKDGNNATSSVPVAAGSPAQAPQLQPQ